MEFLARKDIESVLEILGYSMEDLSRELGVSRITVSNWVNGKNEISEEHLSSFYDFAFKKGIRLNKIKEQLYREDMLKDGEILLFHGAKTKIEGPLSLEKSKPINDFGNGFYCGESLEQSAMFVSSKSRPSLYIAKFSPAGLIKKEYGVDQEWMLTISYFRGGLKEYRDSPLVKKIAEANEGVDYIVAPIADNRIFDLVGQFADGEMTDVQCEHCLSATNLGKQYVFLSEKALRQVELLERCYLADKERESYVRIREEGYKMNQDKIKLAKKRYRNQGRYIEEIMK